MVVSKSGNLSSVGMDVTYYYKDGGSETFKSDRGGLSLIRASALTVYSAAGREIDRVEYKPWVSVVYTGTASKWSYNVFLTVKTRVTTGLPSPTTKTFNTTWTGSPAPVSGSFYNIATFTQTAADLEKISQPADGEHEIIGDLKIDVSLEDSASGAKVIGSKTTQAIISKVKINHSTTLLALKITSVNVGVSTSLIEIQGAQYDCSFIGGC